MTKLTIEMENEFKSGILEYKKAVESLAFNKSDMIFNNSSAEHAAVVLSTMIKYSENEFRLYDDNLSGDIAKLDCDFYKNLENFITSNKILKIAIDYNTENNKSEIFTLLKRYQSSHPKNISIVLANDTFKDKIKCVFNSDIYFALGDKKSFRIEKIGEVLPGQEGRRKALCSFNKASVTEKLVNAFDNAFSSCPVI